MNLIITALLFFSVSHTSGTATISCLQDFIKFEQCIISKFTKDRQNETANAVQEIEQLSDCFATNGCDKPQYDQDPLADLPDTLKLFLSLMNNASADIGDCVRSNVSTLIGDRMKRCLPSTPDIANVGSQLIGEFYSLGQIVSPFEGGALENDAGYRMLAIKVNTFKAIRQCTNANPTVSTNLLSCVNATRAIVQKELCTVIRACSSNITLYCTTQGSRLLDSFCSCKQMLAQAQLSTNLDTIGLNFYIQRAINLAQFCYSKVKKLPLLPLGADQFQLDDNAVTAMKDILMAQTFGSECRPCFTH